jgi:hypothetical protein
MSEDQRGLYLGCRTLCCQLLPERTCYRTPEHLSVSVPPFSP